MIDQVKIGKFIADKRKEKGLTQCALAEKLGITDRAVSKWERGLYQYHRAAHGRRGNGRGL